GDDGAVDAEDEDFFAKARDVLEDAAQVSGFHVGLFSNASVVSVSVQTMDKYSGWSPRRVQRLFQRDDAAVVFLRRADGDANPFRQLIAAHRPGDDAECLHLFKNPLAVADAGEEEVRVG